MKQYYMKSNYMNPNYMEPNDMKHNQINKDRNAYFKPFIAFICIIILMISVFHLPVQAKSEGMPKQLSLYVSKKGDNVFYFQVYKVIHNGEVISVNSSKSSIASVSINSMDKSIMIETKKTGTFTLKTKVKFKNGTKTFTTKVKVYKYVNPCKSLMINGKQINKKFNQSPNYLYRYGNDRNLKIDMKAKSGWDIVYRAYYHDGSSKVYKTNRPVINVDKFGGTIAIDFRNRKTGLVETIVVETTK